MVVRLFPGVGATTEFFSSQAKNDPPPGFAASVLIHFLELFRNGWGPQRLPTANGQSLRFLCFFLFS